MLLLVFRKPVIYRRSGVRIPVYNQAMLLAEPGPVYEYMAEAAPTYLPFRNVRKVGIKPTSELSCAVSAVLGYVFDAPLAQYPFAEPDEAV